jgi:hypothetical protein
MLDTLLHRHLCQPALRGTHLLHPMHKGKSMLVMGLSRLPVLHAQLPSRMRREPPARLPSLPLVTTSSSHQRRRQSILHKVIMFHTHLRTLHGPLSEAHWKVSVRLKNLREFPHLSRPWLPDLAHHLFEIMRLPTSVRREKQATLLSTKHPLRGRTHTRLQQA